MSKASIIVFSHRVRGNSDLAGEILARKCRAAGLPTTLLHSREHPLLACTGCMRCMFRHSRRCHLSDSLPAYQEALAADRLFLVAPVYFLTPASDWKRLQDRMLVMAHPDEYSNVRHAGIVLTAGLPDWTVADPLLAGLALSAGYRVSGVETLTGPGPGQFLADDGNLARLQALFEAVCQGRTQTREGCCEVCFGPLHIRGGGGFCPVCNAAADSAGRVRYEDSRWHPERLRRHYEEWILSTRELYRCDRPRILQKINELNLKEPSAGR